MILDVLILDDDRLARMDLVSLMGDLPGAGRIHEAGTLESAFSLMGEARVYFVDIDLGKGTGFDFVTKIPAREKTAVIFTTAHSAYAHRAFDHDATDYLLKPVGRERLAEAWRRALIRVGAVTPSATFQVETPTGVGRVAVSDLLCVEAEGNYIRLHLRDGRRPLLRVVFSKWVDAFPGGVLVECSRGVAVNARHIRAIDLDAAGATVVRLSDGRTLLVSRRRLSELREALFRLGVTL